MTKEQLEQRVKELEERIEELENDLDYEYENSSQLEEIIEELESKTNNDCYINFDNLIFHLKRNNLYDRKMEDFIEEYFKFYDN